MVLGQKENVFFIYKIYAFTDITVRMTIASLIIVIILIAIMTMMVTNSNNDNNSICNSSK